MTDGWAHPLGQSYCIHTDYDLWYGDVCTLLRKLEDCFPQDILLVSGAVVIAYAYRPVQSDGGTLFWEEVPGPGRRGLEN